MYCVYVNAIHDLACLKNTRTSFHSTTPKVQFALLFKLYVKEKSNDRKTYGSLHIIILHALYRVILHTWVSTEVSNTSEFRYSHRNNEGDSGQVTSQASPYNPATRKYS